MLPLTRSGKARDMQQMIGEQQHWVEEAMAGERDRLVRLCAWLTGDAAAAEDIAQDALIEAWRTADRITDRASSRAWMTGCARNSCKRWARMRGRMLAHELPLDSDDIAPAATIDLERDLDRDELIDLLDRALALLPPETRDALVQHYVDELPQAEIARRLGASEGAVSVRIHRGKLAMRKALSTTACQFIAGSYGIDVVKDDWQETRIWCPHCGTSRMLARLTPGRDVFEIKCPDCACEPGFYSADGEELQAILGGVTSFKPAYNRYTAWVHAEFSQALAHRGVTCLACGSFATLRMGLSPQSREPRRSRRGFHVTCPSCHRICDMGLSAYALWLPEGREFQKAHSRVHLLPEREVDADGVAAIVTTFESLSNGERYAVLSEKETLRTLRVHRGHDA